MSRKTDFVDQLQEKLDAAEAARLAQRTALEGLLDDWKAQHRLLTQTRTHTSWTATAALEWCVGTLTALLGPGQPTDGNV